MITLKRTNSEDIDFLELVKALDMELAQRDGDEHAFFAQYNKVDAIRHVVVAYEGKIPIGCGAVKPFSTDTMEVKRMFVPPVHRGRGIASLILKELEAWTRELHFSKCILETGYRQPEAIALYKKNGYIIIPNYGQYTNVESSVCFEKNLM